MMADPHQRSLLSRLHTASPEPLERVRLFVRSWLAAFARRGSIREAALNELVLEVHGLVSDITAELCEVPEHEAEREAVRDAIEKLVTSKLYDAVFGVGDNGAA